jgi:putative ABC transport system permease protein
MADQIALWQMAVTYMLLLVVFLLVMLNRLRIGRELLIATVRMTLQLIAAGLLLRYLFEFNFWYTSLLLLLIMVALAVHVILGRVRLRIGRLSLILFLSIAVAGLSILAVFIFLIVGHEPWYDARYLIPIGGMIIGNAMTACALVTERFFSEVSSKKRVIEANLALGATSKEASIHAFRASYKAALLPTVASMTGMGIVHLPGMMTGQILSGTEPILAVKYQIAIVVAILCSAAISSLLALHLVRGRLFNRYHQIVMPDFDDG